MKKLLVILSLIAVAACSVVPKQPAEWRVKPVNVDPKERTLWPVCVNRATGWVGVPSDNPPHIPLCLDWEFIEYRLPIEVGERSGNLFYKATTKLAVQQWNSWLEWPGFMKYVGDAPHADVEVKFAHSDLYWGQADPQWSVDRKRFVCDSYVFHTGTEIGMVLLHELGHCLGLAHDGNIMVDNDYEVPNSVMKQGLKAPDYTLTDADKVALWGIYDNQT